jgi:hypothetical protein
MRRRFWSQVRRSLSASASPGYLPQRPLNGPKAAERSPGGTLTSPARRSSPRASKHRGGWRSCPTEARWSPSETTGGSCGCAAGRHRSRSRRSPASLRPVRPGRSGWPSRRVTGGTVTYAYFTSSIDNRIVRFRLTTPQVQEPILTGYTRPNSGRAAGTRSTTPCPAATAVGRSWRAAATTRVFETPSSRGRPPKRRPVVRRSPARTSSWLPCAAPDCGRHRSTAGVAPEPRPASSSAPTAGYAQSYTRLTTPCG